MKKSIVFLPAILLIACSALTGEEVGRLAINQVSSGENLITQEASVVLEAGDEIIFWSEMDMEYTGNVALRFRVSIKKGDEPYGNMEIDPTEMDLTLGESKTTENGKTSWSFSAQNAAFNVQEDGTYTFQAILVASENQSIVIKKAELVLKKI